MIAYLSLMCQGQGIGELCAATSDLANQTGIEKIDLLIIHKPNLISSNFKKHKWAKIELTWAFMPVMVTSNFDEDSIKNEQASMETPFSHYKSMGIVFRRSRAANSIVSGPISPKFELVQDFRSDWNPILIFKFIKLMYKQS